MTTVTIHYISTERDKYDTNRRITWAYQINDQKPEGEYGSKELAQIGSLIEVLQTHGINIRKPMNKLITVLKSLGAEEHDGRYYLNVPDGCICVEPHSNGRVSVNLVFHQVPAEESALEAVKSAIGASLARNWQRPKDTKMCPLCNTMFVGAHADHSCDPQKLNPAANEDKEIQ